MAIFLLIISILCWCASFVTLFYKQLLAPALSYLGLLLLSFAQEGGYPLVPVNNAILLSWLTITVVVMLAVMLQPSLTPESRSETGYMLGGALTGLAVGLLGYSYTTSVSMMYGIMVIATAAGTFFGFLVFANTLAGRKLKAEGRFFQSLLAQGFPVAITAMQAGLPLVIIIARHALASQPS